jgi:PBSX family phage portal protein
MTDAAQQTAVIDVLRDALKNSKGPGNFRNLFMYAPNGKKDGLQLIPISEVAAKDDFASIKNTSRDDILAAHRVPPQLLGMIPTNAGGFGDVEKAKQVFMENEVTPIQAKMVALNELVGVKAFCFLREAGAR